MTDSRWAIGIDIGGTKIAAGLVELAAGAVHARRQVPTDRRDGGAPALQAALDVAAELTAQARGDRLDLAGIGIGVPELVDNAGRVRGSYNFAWTEIDVRARFAAIAPTVVDSDVRAAARAEARYGAGRGAASCVYVTVGTGISYTLVLDGEPYRGARGYAIHFASSPWLTPCAQCGHEHEEVLEEVASGPGLVRRYRALGDATVKEAEEVLAAAAAGEPEAVALVGLAGRQLGRAVGLLINALDPERVVIGGGLGLAGGLFAEALVGAARGAIFAADARDLPILPAALGADAGIIGAAAALAERR